MKNLFKTLITVITVVCMLCSMTAFAATQTTVTSYVSDTSVNVVSTVSGVAKDVIVTYLASNSADATIDANEIKYINQKTSDGENDVVFSYAISDVEGWEAKDVISTVQYGSSAELDIEDDQILFDEIPFSVTCGGAAVDGAYLSVTKIGKGDTVEVNITPELGYEIDTVTIGGDVADTTVGTYEVAYGDEVVVTVKEVTSTKVYLFDDVVANDGLDIYYGDTKLNVLTGVACFVGGPVESASIVFDGVNVDGAHHDYTYAAADVTGNAGYFAVQLAQEDAFADGAKATDAIVTTEEGTFRASDN